MKAILIAPIKFYQKYISQFLAPRCKYYPSCSNYAVSAITTYGIKGIAMSAYRVLRCNPWSYGGVDYVPERNKSKKTVENSGYKQVISPESTGV